MTIREGITNASGGSIGIGANVVVASDQTWDSGVSLGVDRLSGSGTLRKTGSGVLSVNNPETFTGRLIVESGTFKANYGTAPFSPITVQNATLTIGGNYTGRLTLDGNAILDQGVTFSGGIDGPGTLNLVGGVPGTSDVPQFAMSGGNSYSGGTVIGRAQLTVSGNQQSLGTGGVTMKEGATLVLASESNLASDQRVTMENGSVLLLAAPGIDPGRVIDAASTTGGTLGLAAGTRSAMVNMAAFGNGELFLAANGEVIYTASTLGVGAGNTYRLSGVGTLTITGTDNVLTGSASVVIGQPSGSGTVQLNQSNDFTGGLTLENSALVVANDHALGSGILTLKSGRLSPADGAGPRVIANDVILPTSQYLWLGGSEALNFTGTINLQGGERILLVWGPSPIVFANTIANGSLNLGSGHWVLQGDNDLTNLTVSGVVEFERSSNLKTASLIRVNQGTLKPMASAVLNETMAFGQINGVGSGTIDIADGISLTLTGQTSGRMNRAYPVS